MSCAVVWFCQIHLQNQPPEMFLKKGALKKFGKIHRKHLCLNLFACSSFFPCALWGNMVGIDPSVNFRWPFAVK